MAHFTRRLFMGAAAATATANAFGLPAFAQGRPVKIGVLADFSGIYTDLMGPAGVACVQQAIDDIGPGFPVEVVFGDHQNKADIGAGIARRWFDTDGVDMLIAGPNSAVGLAASGIAHEKNKPCLGVAVTATDFTGKACTPTAINWTYDGYMLSKAAATETVRAGGKKWYFITTDNAFGHSLQTEATTFINEAGSYVQCRARRVRKTMPHARVYLAVLRPSSIILMIGEPSLGSVFYRSSRSLHPLV